MRGARCAVVGSVCALACAALLAGSMSGCSSNPARGYSFERAYDESVRSVAVPIFDNVTFHEGLEYELTEALGKEIRRATPWRLTDPDLAAVTLTGEIVAVDVLRLSTTRGTGFVEEQGYRITVDFEWKDNRTGEVLLERRSFSAASAFVPAAPSGERIEVGRHGAVDELARAVVAELRSAW